eukprot:UN16983
MKTTITENENRMIVTTENRMITTNQNRMIITNLGRRIDQYPRFRENQKVPKKISWMKS